MSAFFQALEQGYAPEEILKYLSKSIPQVSKPIQKAQRAGYSVQQILGFLSKNFDNQDRRGMTETERHTANKRADTERTKYGLKMAATAVAAPIASKALSSALSRSLPQSLKSLAPSLASQSALPGGGNTPTPQAGNISLGTQTPPTSLQPQTNQLPTTAQPVLSSASQQPPIGSNVTSVTQPQPNAQPEGIINPKEYLDKLGIKDKVDDLLKRGNSPEQAAATLGMKGGMGKVRGEIDPELLANIDAYAKLPHGVPEEKIENVPIAKNETVSTPHGVGEVKEIRNGKAIVEVNGKKHQVDEEELEASPLPEKDLAALYDELIQGIEGETGEDVSRMVQWAGYNPETNTLQFLPHTGKLYKYGNISPEDAALLTDILSTRKTSGENFIGAWKAGSKSPIGAALSKLIRKLQAERGGKGQEYEETHEPIYSAYEPAVQAAKKKKKKK